MHDEGKIPRVRSVSMSMYMNYMPDDSTGSYWRKAIEIRKPEPTKAFVFIDEAKAASKNSRFYLNQPGINTWVDFVSVRHNNGGVPSFADGHAEAWRWREPNTIRISKLKGWIQNQNGAFPIDRDLRRLQQCIPVVPIR